MVDLFAERLEANLPHMHPRQATEQALLAVKGFLDGSDFIDLSSKSTTGRHYLRVDKKPEINKRRGGGEAMR
jgi:hypothetical protein